MKLRRQPPVVDALTPLDTITQALLTVVVLFLVVFSAGVVLSGWTMFEVNGPSICVDAGFTLDHGSDGKPDAADRELLGLADGTTVLPGDSTVCQDHPSAVQRFLVGLKNIPTFAVFCGFLVLARRLIATARREGLFNRALARHVERLGWLLVGGLVLASTTEWLADGALRSTMYDASWASGAFDISIAGLIGGYGIVSIGRVMARAADLQDDVEGTV